MIVRDIINKICDSHPDGIELLNKIEVTTLVMIEQFGDKSHIDDFSNINHLNGGSNTLKELLDVSRFILSDQIEKFVLSELQKYINSD